MKKKIIISVFVSLLVVFANSLLAQKEVKKRDLGKDRLGPPALVEVARIKKKTIQSTIDLVGVVDSPRISNVSSEVAGLVKEIRVKEGDEVEEGDVMVILENSQLRILLNEARAGLSQASEYLKELQSGPRPMEVARARAAVSEAQARLTIAEHDYLRNKELYDKKVISKRQFTNSSLETTAARELYHQRKSAYELIAAGTRKEKIAQQKAKVRIMAAKAALIREQLRKKSIRSPFSGVVVQKFVERGEWLARGRPVVRVVQMDPLRIDIMVPEKIISFVKLNDSTTTRFDSLNPGHMEGKVSAILPLADTASRTFPVRIMLNNPHKKLKLGMTARVSLSYGPKEEVFLVPQDALIFAERKKMIVVLSDRNTAKPIAIQTGRVIGNLIEVIGDLRENERVVVKGNERLLPGQAVQPIEADGEKP